MTCRFRVQKFIEGDLQGGGWHRVTVLGIYETLEQAQNRLAEFTPDPKDHHWVHYEILIVLESIS